MKSIRYVLTLAFGLAFLVGIMGCAESGSSHESGSLAADTAGTSYDSALAQKLEADEYGMHRYVVALLKAGPNRAQDSARVQELQQAHLENIRRLAGEGSLVLAGPFLDDGPLRGIYVFDVPTVEEARKLTVTDPAIKAGRLEMELHPWYGSAAVMQINEIHSRISRKNP